MDFIPSETSLVVAGAWNAAILTPGWVLRHGLSVPEGREEQVQVFMPAGAGVMFEFPRYTLPQLTYVVRSDALILAPNSAEEASFAVLETAAASMLTALRHTPVTGVGHNFEFRSSDVAPEHLDVFTLSGRDISDNMPQGWSGGASVINSSFQKDDGAVVVTIARRFDAGTVSVKFNFHHPVVGIDQAIQVVKSQGNYQSILSNFALAKNLVTNLYGGDT